MDDHIYRPDVRVRLVGRQPFFGPGPALLLRHIQECGSVTAACEKMQLSYSKGRGMIRKLEQETGFCVVQRIKGGPGGGNAKLTHEGELLLEIYTRYADDVCRYAERRFDMVLEFLQLNVEG